MRELLLWGLQRDEYQSLFDLTDDDLTLCLLEYDSGPNAVNASLAPTGGKMTSCDALFRLDKEALKAVVHARLEEQSRLVSSSDTASYQLTDLKALIEKRQQGLAIFFADYNAGCMQKRYVAVKSDVLPFNDFLYDLALSTHLLFQQTDESQVPQLLQQIKELTRVAREVRIAPLMDSDGHPTPLLGPILLGLQEGQYGVEVRKVTHDVIYHHNAMIRVWAQQCPVG